MNIIFTSRGCWAYLELRCISGPPCVSVCVCVCVCVLDSSWCWNLSSQTRLVSHREGLVSLLKLKPFTKLNTRFDKSGNERHGATRTPSRPTNEHPFTRRNTSQVTDEEAWMSAANKLLPSFSSYEQDQQIWSKNRRKCSWEPTIKKKDDNMATSIPSQLRVSVTSGQTSVSTLQTFSNKFAWRLFGKRHRGSETNRTVKGWRRGEEKREEGGNGEMENEGKEVN